MKQTTRFTPAIANVTGKRPQEKMNVRVFIGKGGPKKKAKKTTYRTPKVSGVGWGY